MEALCLFLWKSIVVSGLLTSWYILGLRGRRLHQYNRFFLLSALLVSITIPFLRFQIFSIAHVASGNLAPVSLFVQSVDSQLSNLSLTQQPEQRQLDWKIVAVAIAAAISATLLLILLMRILKVRKLCKQSPATQLEGINLIETDMPRAPFTFLNYVFWNRTIPLDGEIGRLIFRHELTHIEQGHTYDKLVCQALTCIFWFNPFYWIIQRELNIVHEFIADEHAVSDRDTETFSLMMLQTYSNGSFLAPGHQFFSSSVKRRLTMLQNVTKPSHAMLRRLMVLPLLIGTILLFSCTIRNNPIAHTDLPKKKIVVLLDPAHGGNDAGGHDNGYMEKDICLQYAKRMKELAAAYNIEVRLTRDDDRFVKLADRVALAARMNPDVFISLHVGDEPGTDKAKGDFDIYVSGGNSHASQSNSYSSAIFMAMEQNGVIPGGAKGCKHDRAKACRNCASAPSQADNSKITSIKKDGIYVLKNAQGPALIMSMGNIKNKDGMRQLTDGSHMDALCSAVLKGIVIGAAEKPDAPITAGGCGTPPNPGLQIGLGNFITPQAK